jgi:photosystem II stability/assembly factor-like uncharacterized protein
VSKRTSVHVVLLALVGVSTALGASGRHGYAWDLTPTGSAARLRGVSAISANTAWTSGSLGTVLRTVNGGQTWQNVSPPDTAALQFRDIEAFDAGHAVILSIGNGSDSRVYVTSDAGQHWTQTFTNDDPNAFYDCMTFFNSRRGLALSDPVGSESSPRTTAEAAGTSSRPTCRRRCPVSSRSPPAASAWSPTTGGARGSGPVVRRRRASSTPTTAARAGR